MYVIGIHSPMLGKTEVELKWYPGDVTLLDARRDRDWNDIPSLVLELEAAGDLAMQIEHAVRAAKEQN